MRKVLCYVNQDDRICTLPETEVISVKKELENLVTIEWWAKSPLRAKKYTAHVKDAAWIIVKDHYDKNGELREGGSYINISEVD